jgi:16S rRNA (adenine1518-N6/adenine1519-N6)-dimethyltransferase
VTTTQPGPLLGAVNIRELAAELGLHPSKQRGQNFVTDANTVRRIVAAAGILPGDRVLEIGPGLGSLTLGLLEAGAKVTAIEIDELLAGRLQQTVAEHQPDNSGNLRLIRADALQVDSVPDPPPTKLVSNLPYNVAVPLVLHAFETIPQLESGLVMVQLEVADRMTAAPGSRVYGVPSVKLAWFADAQKAGTVGPNVFWPKPNVDSGLVRLRAHRPPDTTASRADVFRVVDAAFGQRRKMLRASLSSLAGGSQRASQLLEAAGVDPTTRAERLDIADFSHITTALQSSFQPSSGLDLA